MYGCQSCYSHMICWIGHVREVWVHVRYSMFSVYTSIQLNVHSDRNKAVHFRMYSAEWEWEIAMDKNIHLV